MIGLKYPDNQHVDVQLHYTEQIPLTLQQKGGKPMLWFDQPRQSMEISVAKTRYGITREIVEDAALGTLSLLTQSSAIVEALSHRVELVDLNEHIGVAILNETAFAESAAAHPVKQSRRMKHGPEKLLYTEPVAISQTSKMHWQF